jgi:hypothetical protein
MCVNLNREKSFFSVEFYSNTRIKGEIMADNVLRQELKKILKEMGTLEYSNKLYCSIMKVLQMRHSDFDQSQARRIIKELSQ